MRTVVASVGRSPQQWPPESGEGESEFDTSRHRFALLQPVVPRTAQVDRKLSVIQENPLRLFTATLFGANLLTALGPTNTDMVIGYASSWLPVAQL